MTSHRPPGSEPANLIETLANTTGAGEVFVTGCIIVVGFVLTGLLATWLTDRGG